MSNYTKLKEMKNKFYKIMMIGVLSLSIPTVMGQVATSLYFMDNLPQSSILNPAFDPNYGFYLGIPIINNTNISFNSDIGLSEIYNDGEFLWNSIGAYNKFVNELPKTSYLSMELNSSLFNLGFVVGDVGYFHASVTNRFDMTLGIPQDLFRMIDLYQPHDLSGLELEARMFNEYALGYSHSFGEKLVVGVKAKFLTGVAATSLTFEELDFDTDSEKWGLNVKGSLNQSAPFESRTDENGYPEDAELSIDQNNITEIIDYTFKSYHNPGFGVDLGVEYQVIPRLKLSASLIDLGKINWQRDVVNYNIDGEYDFYGFKNYITTDSDGSIAFDDEALSKLTDTIKSVMPATETNEAFSTSLIPKLFLGAEYELTQSLSLGVLYKARFIREEVRQNVYFNANANFKSLLTLGANFNYGIDSQNSYGGVIGVRLSPFYLYFAADVLPGYGKTTIVNENNETQELPFSLPGDLSAANFQFGVNIVLGERRRVMAKKEKRDNMPSLFDENTENSSVNYPF